MAKEKDVLMDHEYDGIRELDNDLPPWWLWLFYITIAFAIIYLFHYHVFETGDLMVAEYNKELNPDWKPSEESASLSSSLIQTYHSPYYNPKGEVTPYILALFNEYIGPNVDFNMLIAKAIYRADDSQLEKLKSTFPEIWEQLQSGEQKSVMKAVPALVKDIPKYNSLTDEANLAKGKDVYVINCLSCHGKFGEGLIGPNFTDDYWIHGAGVSNMINIINIGVPAKGMITWSGILKEDEIIQVASYILTLHGTNPPNPKAPQGELVQYPLQD